MRRPVPSHAPPNFLDDFDAATVPCPVSTSVSRMFPGVPVSIDLAYVSGDTYATLDMFEAHPGTRGTGAGTEAMRRLLDLADKHGITIFLDPHPLDSGWSWARLVKWYASFGFVFEEEDEEDRKASANYWMMRRPDATGTRRPNPRRPVLDFLDDFNATTVPCPVGWHTSRMFPDVPVSIILGDEVTYVTINYLQAHPRTRATGAGTEAMRRILDLADKHGVTVFLDPVPLDAGWSWARLGKWYASFGFVFEEENGGSMVRVPHSKGARRQNPRRRNPHRRNPDQQGHGVDPRILAADGARYFSDEALAEADREAAPSKSRTALVLMHPRDFLAMAEPGKREEAQAALERVLDAGTRLSDVPRLFIDVSRGDATVAVVTGHEGRHRSRALLARGVTQMPVRIHSHNIRWGEQTDPESWDYEPVLPSVLFGEGANRQNTLPMPVPLHYPELAPRLRRSLANPSKRSRR